MGEECQTTQWSILNGVSLFLVQLCTLKTKHVRFLSRLFTWVDCSAGDTRSSEKGQMRERRLEESREPYIVQSDGLLSIHWFSFVLAQSTCAAALSRFASLTRTHSVHQLSGAYSQFKALLGSHSNTWMLRTKIIQIEEDHFFHFWLLKMVQFLAEKKKNETAQQGESFWLVGPQ